MRNCCSHRCGTSGRARVARRGRLPALRAWCSGDLWSQSLSYCAKKLLDFPNDLIETVDLGCGIIHVKAGARSGFHTEFFHEGLVAVVAASQRDSGLVRDCNDVVSMDALEQKA